MRGNGDIGGLICRACAYVARAGIEAICMKGNAMERSVLLRLFVPQLGGLAPGI